MDTCHLALFMEQYLPSNEENFCVYFMEFFELFFSIEYMNGPDHDAREWPQGNIPSTLLAFLQSISKLVLKMEEHCKNSVSRSEAYLFNQMAQEKLLVPAVMAITAIC
ncbi:hypothetical protein RF11_08746 [Thelohanellus kitauei]|uniref:Uncharacterized protein n=1 Tax=Thelohanellus kitauei TaxID=669202 RepID=A0A0C2MNZ8_THEKT|nr:hypothetical protein RF11_08746 [Thelohanellus kitauei]